jgi:hypothetical protein
LPGFWCTDIHWRAKPFIPLILMRCGLRWVQTNTPYLSRPNVPIQYTVPFRPCARPAPQWSQSPSSVIRWGGLCSCQGLDPSAPVWVRRPSRAQSPACQPAAMLRRASRVSSDRPWAARTELTASRREDSGAPGSAVDGGTGGCGLGCGVGCGCGCGRGRRRKISCGRGRRRKISRSPMCQIGGCRGASGSMIPMHAPEPSGKRTIPLSINSHSFIVNLRLC